MNPLTATRNMLIERGRKAVSLYYEIVYALAAPKHVNTMNYGFAPVTENLRQFHPSKDQALQYELYWQTFSQLDDSLNSSEILCEVGCGRGGGLAFLQKLTEATVVGLERSRSARRYAHKYFRLDVRSATAPILPLEDESIDVFLSVEAAHLYHNDRFVSELNRCLKVGGFVLLADCHLGSNQHVHDRLSSLYSANGFAIDEWRDIRPNVLQALGYDEPRKQALMAILPGFLREEAGLYMGMVNSPRFNEMKRDLRAYFIFRARKQENS